ncbi:MAG: DUF447 domain-containing protein [Promethearchaeota archaeon]|jgi:hypothetical protein
MDVNFQELGLKKGYLYEILATTFSIKRNELIPNTSCMGIRIRANNEISIEPYPNTNTYKNLKQNYLICINFVEGIFLYALAALKGLHLSEKYRIFPTKYYSYYDIREFNKSISKIPYINQAWATLFCEIKKESQLTRKDIFGKINLSKFILNILSLVKIKESYKLFNRAENLTLETLILTTRLKIAFEKHNRNLITDFQSKIEDNIRNIRRFGKNQDALKAIELIEEYLRKLKSSI